MLCSYDIFDTLITRKTATPRGVFIIMSYLLVNRYKNEFSENFERKFWKIRIDCEKEAFRRNKIGKEINFLEIYDFVKDVTALSEKQIQILIDLELELERNLTFPIRENIEKLKSDLEANNNVVLISDMYLSEANIRDILIKIDSNISGLPIFVSSAYGVRKTNGLFERIYEELLPINGGWIHYGDNRISDIEAARESGIKGEYSFPKELLPWEKQIFRESDLAWQLVCGVSKISRLGHKESNPFNVGCSLGFSILFSFTKWVVDECEEIHLSHIFLIARDGFILKPIFEEYIKKRGYSIKIHYLYCSREVSLNTEYSAILQEYLNQEFKNIESAALVDTKGTGTTVKYLSDRFIKKPLHCYMMYHTNKTESSYCIFHSYRIYTVGVAYLLTELLTRALHGKTVGYKKENGRIRPILRNDENLFLEEYGYREYLKGVQVACSHLMEFSSFLIEKADFDGVSELYFQYLDNLNDGNLLNWFGDMPFSDLRNKREVVWQYAPKLTKKQILMLVKGRELINEEYRGFCLSISMLRLNEEEKEKIENSKRKIKKAYRINVKKIKKNVVLYGAGQVGKQIYHQLEQLDTVKVKLWVDRQFLKVRREGYSVESFEKLFQIEFDQIIIAVANKIVAEEIKEQLKSRGIPKEKIYWQDYLISNE